MARYIVNPSGGTHTVPDDWQLPVGYRDATAEEIASYVDAYETPHALPPAPDPAEDDAAEGK